MEQEVTVRGLRNQNNYTPGSRNPLARTIRSAGFRTRIVKNKKGKGSYKRKGRVERSFFIPWRQLKIIIWYYKFPKVTYLKNDVVKLTVKRTQRRRQKGTVK
jgi:stalled ribosome alternative rescue factor ArfA